MRKYKDDLRSCCEDFVLRSRGVADVFEFTCKKCGARNVFTGQRWVQKEAVRTWSEEIKKSADKKGPLPDYAYIGPKDLVAEFTAGKMHHHEFIASGGMATFKGETERERGQACIIRNAKKEHEVLRLQKDAAYRERNQLLAALSRSSDYAGYLARHPDDDKDWDDDWRWIVFLYKKTPAGADWKPTQMTWHIHDSELPLFDHLPVQENDWDGHDTTEKYRRLRKLNEY